MKALRISDLETGQQVLAVDLRHVLQALGKRALESEWRVQEVWAEGDAKPEFTQFDGSQVVSGEHLMKLARNVTQIIDGEFSAFDPGAEKPWTVIEAVDSSFYTVRSDDESTLGQVRSAFREVTDYEHPGA